MSDARKIWISPTPDAAAVKHLQEHLRLREPVARVLVNRAIVTSEQAQDYLSQTLQALPDPFLLKGMDLAVRRIEKAIRRREKIVAWGDYDVDGVTSLALLTHFFKAISYPLTAEIPLRIEDGYGLQMKAVERLAKQGAQLIVTVDNGISSAAEIERARELGVDVIVVDHHQIPETFPDVAVAVVNPLQPDCSFPFKDLAACGLSFMLLAGLRRYLVERDVIDRESAPNLKNLLDIVALGTVADLVPLTGLNRLFVRYGLPILSRSKRPGVLALKEVSRVDVDADVDAYTVGFMLAPRINAGGRMSDAKAGLTLLTTDHLAEARQLAALLDKNNNFRRSIQERMLEEALQMLESDEGLQQAPALVLAKEGWHEGVIGLVASKLVDHSFRPTVVIALDEEGGGKGSCRSIPAFHMQQALERNCEYLDTFGGHHMAAGLSLRAERLADFTEAFMEDARQHLTERDYIPELATDGPCSLSEIDYDLLDQLEKLAPYGMSNRQPMFTEQGVTIATARLLKGKHWKLKLMKDERILEAIAFGQGERELLRGQRIDIAYVPEYNSFRGAKSIQLRLVDMRSCEEEV